MDLVSVMLTPQAHAHLIGTYYWLNQMWNGNYLGMTNNAI